MAYNKIMTISTVFSTYPLQHAVVSYVYGPEHPDAGMKGTMEWKQIDDLYKARLLTQRELLDSISEDLGKPAHMITDNQADLFIITKVELVS